MSSSPHNPDHDPYHKGAQDEVDDEPIVPESKFHLYLSALSLSIVAGPQAAAFRDMVRDDDISSPPAMLRGKLVSTAFRPEESATWSTLPYSMSRIPHADQSAAACRPDV